MPVYTQRAALAEAEAGVAWWTRDAFAIQLELGLGYLYVFCRMSWVTVIWAMIVSACLTLSGVHVLVWLRQRGELANLMFALLAAGTAGMAACELSMMHARTPEEYSTLLRWFHVPVWVAVVSLVGFIHFHQQAGRAWLAWATIGARTISLGINFLSAANINYREITSLQRIPFLGEPVSVPLGVPNPWMLLGQLSLLLLLAYVVDASLAAWWRGEKRTALLVGGSTTIFVAVGIAQAILVFWRVIPIPVTTSLFFTGLVMVMGYELSSRVLRAAQMARELRQREAELSRERALTEAVFDSVPGLLYLYTADGKFVRWNKQYGFRTGYTTTEMAKMTAADWFEPEDLETMRAGWSQVLAGGSITMELPVRMKDGSRVPYLLTGVRVFIDNQPHLVGIGIDIAHRKAMELEATRQRAELAHLSRVASLSELSGSLAHELNQPLGIILTNAQAAQRLLSREPLDLAEVRDILADIVSEDRRAGEVIHRLRALLKGGEPKREPLTLNDLVEEVVALMRSDLIGRGVTLNLQLAAGLPLICGDRIPLEQVLMNLVSNGCDAMGAYPAAERQLTISTQKDEAGVKVSVRDAGCGLPPEPARMFESFFTTKPQGLGMGLAICRTIITTHGGKIWAEPNSDRGATFHVVLPCTKEHA